MGTAIPCAIGPGDATVYPHEADYADYLCPRCGQPVNLRKAQKQFFAHNPNPGSVCPWRTGVDFDQDLEEQSARTAADYAAKQALRLVIERRPWDQGYDLLARLPVFSPQDLGVVSKTNLLGQGLVLPSKGLKQPLPVDALNRPDGFLLQEVEEQANGYEVDLSGYPLSVSGKWTCGPLQTGQFFVGDETRAERVQHLRWASSGQMLYYIEGPSFPGPHGSTRFTLGPHRLARFKAGPEAKAWLNQHRVSLDSNPIRVDVVLPLFADSHASLSRTVAAKAGSRVTLAVVPHAKSDPQLEVLPLPYQKGRRLVLKPSGVGVPRYFQATVPSAGSQGLLVVWPHFYGRAVLIELVPGSEVGAHTAQESTEVGVANKGNLSTIASALEGESFSWDCRVDNDGLDFRQIRLVKPPWLRATVSATYSTGPPQMAQPVDESNFEQTCRSLFEDGASEVRVDFGQLGFVRVSVPALQQVLRERAARREAELLQRQAIEAAQAQAAAEAEAGERRKRAEEAEHSRQRRLHDEEAAKMRLAAEQEQARIAALRRQEQAEAERIAKEHRRWLGLLERKLQEAIGTMADPPRHASVTLTRELLGAAGSLSAPEFKRMRSLVRKLLRARRQEVGSRGEAEQGDEDASDSDGERVEGDPIASEIPKSDELVEGPERSGAPISVADAPSPETRNLAEEVPAPPPRATEEEDTQEPRPRKKRRGERAPRVTPQRPRAGVEGKLAELRTAAAGKEYWEPAPAAALLVRRLGISPSEAALLLRKHGQEIHKLLKRLTSDARKRMGSKPEGA